MKKKDVEISKLSLKDFKIIDVTFDKEEEDQGVGEEVYEDEPESVCRGEAMPSFDEILGVRHPFYIRVLSAITFLLAIVCNLVILCGFLGATILSGVRYFMGYNEWNASALKCWKLYCRSLACILIALVGVFNVPFALAILSVYFSLFDPDTSLVSLTSKLSEQ